MSGGVADKGAGGTGRRRFLHALAPRWRRGLLATGWMEKAKPPRTAARVGLGAVLGKRGGLPGDLSAEAANQAGGLPLHPFMTLAHGLAIPENLLGVASIQIYQAMGCEDSGKADQECKQADVYPRETHRKTPVKPIWQADLAK